MIKVTVEKEELQKKLADIQNIVEKKNTMPILNHFLLTADKQSAYITATDLETAFKEPIAVTVAEEGKICIPARKLFEIVKEMDGEVVIESTDAQWVKVKSGKSHFRIACLSHEEFPVWPAMTENDKQEIEMDAPLLLETIEKTIYAAGESDTRYVLNGLLLHIKADGSLTVVGTDGHRLSLYENVVNTRLKEEKKIIVSRKSVAELRRFLGTESKTVKMTVGKNHILFSIEDMQFLTRLIEGTYPNYEQVIPADNQKILNVDRSLLAKALRRVSIMSKERSSAVKVDIEAGNLVVSASNPDLGEARDEIAVEYNGDAMTLAFNARYVLDALSVMSAEKVTFRLNEPLSPALITEDGKADYKCVVMPMRL